MIDLKTVIIKSDLLFSSGDYNLVNQEYIHGVYPGVESVISFLPVLRGIMLALCKDNYDFVSNVTSDVYVCLVLNGKKEVANTVVHWYINTVSYAVKNETVSFISRIPFFDGKNVPQEVKTFFKAVFNHPEMIQNLIKANKWKPYWLLHSAMNRIYSLIEPENAMYIFQNSKANSTRLIIGNVPALLEDVQAQVQWVRIYNRLRVVQAYIKCLHVTDKAIDAMDPKTAFMFAESVATNWYSLQSGNIYFDTDKLLAKASVYAFASGISMDKIKTQIDKLKKKKTI